MRDDGFAALRAAAAPLGDFDRPWFVAGGWALDLAAGTVTREHADLDLSVFREDLPALCACLRDWQAQVAIPGAGVLAPLQGAADAALPVHEVHFLRGPQRLEVLLEDHADGRVRFRRDPRIGIALGDFARRSCGLPHVAAHWQLLYKAKDARSKDDADFARHLPLLTAGERGWLRRALALHLPQSGWLHALR